MKISTEFRHEGRIQWYFSFILQVFSLHSNLYGVGRVVSENENCSQGNKGLAAYSIQRWGAILPTYTQQVRFVIFLTRGIWFRFSFYTAEAVVLADPSQSLSNKEC